MLHRRVRTTRRVLGEVEELTHDERRFLRRGEQASPTAEREILMEDHFDVAKEGDEHTTKTEVLYYGCHSAMTERFVDPESECTGTSVGATNMPRAYARGLHISVAIDGA